MRGRPRINRSPGVADRRTYESLCRKADGEEFQEWKLTHKRVNDLLKSLNIDDLRVVRYEIGFRLRSAGSYIGVAYPGMSRELSCLVLGQIALRGKRMPVRARTQWPGNNVAA